LEFEGVVDVGLIVIAHFEYNEDIYDRRGAKKERKGF
jgi:hypothetical protein